MRKIDFLGPPVIKDADDSIVPILGKDQMFYGICDKQLIEYSASETELYRFILKLEQKFITCGIDLGSEVSRSMKTMAALFDAYTAIPYLLKGETDIIGEGFPAFVVYHKERNTPDFSLAFANAAYLKETKIGNLSDIVGLSESYLMNKIYTPNNVSNFRIAARNPQGGYDAKFIEIDRINDGQKKAYFWSLREFHHPDGSTIQVRIGMNVSSLTKEQMKEVSNIYNIAKEVNKQKSVQMNLSTVSYKRIILDIQKQVDLIMRSTNQKKTTLIPALKWLRMLFEIADTIVNSPVPLVITNNNKVEQMNLSYSLIGGGLNNGSSFERIITNPVLESIQKRFGKILPVCHEIPVGGYIQFHRIIQSQHFSDRTQQ